MVWEAWKKHDSNTTTFLGYFKDDGFVKKKKLGRIDVYNSWESIKNKWIKLYNEKKVLTGMSACVKLKDTDEWDCEAYMKTDFSKLSIEDFNRTITDYISYSIKVGDVKNVKINSFNNASQIDTKSWKEFKMNELFSYIKRGKRLIEMDRIPGDIKYFSASQENNGLTDLISEPLFVDKDALIYTTFGDCYYIKGSFTASDEISILKYDKMNLFNALFVATVINKNKYKFAFGRKAFKNKFENEIIKLPVKLNKKTIIMDKNKKYSQKGYIPDFEYMEKIIKPMFTVN